LKSDQEKVYSMSKLIVGWREGAKALGLSPNAVYQAIRQGILPAMRIGAPGKRGRLIIDLELCEQAIRDKMIENLRTKPEQPNGSVRKVK
jgi:hypothetical protein